jgi:hypothetical protein
MDMVPISYKGGNIAVLERWRAMILLVMTGCRTCCRNPEAAPGPSSAS